MAKSSAPTTWQLIAYSLPGFAITMIVVPVTAIMPSLYSHHARVSLVASGSILIGLRVFDAFADQLIGYWSDLTRSRMGPRKPWVLAGGVVTAVSVVFLFWIPPTAGILYYGFWSMVFYFGWAMYSIPHTTWGGELSNDYDGRTRVFSYRGLLEAAGGIAWPLVPILLVVIGVSNSEEITPQTSRILGISAALALPFFVVFAVWIAPSGQAVPNERTGFLDLVRSIAHNKAYLRFIAAFILAGAGTGIFAALLFPYVDAYLQIGDHFPRMLLVVTVVSMAAIPVWSKIANWMGKHRAWAYGWLINAIILVPLAWVEPGESAVWPVTILMALYGFTNTVSVAVPYAILADIIDYDIFKTGIDRAGNYYAFQMFAVKMTAASGGLALIALGRVFGYSLEEGHVNDAFANSGMKWLFIAGPAITQLCTLPLIWNFPIDERRQRIIRRRIEQRAARKAARV